MGCRVGGSLSDFFFNVSGAGLNSYKLWSCYIFTINIFNLSKNKLSSDLMNKIMPPTHTHALFWFVFLFREAIMIVQAQTFWIAWYKYNCFILKDNTRTHLSFYFSGCSVPLIEQSKLDQVTYGRGESNTDL